MREGSRLLELDTETQNDQSLVEQTLAAAIKDRQTVTPGGKSQAVYAIFSWWITRPLRAINRTFFR